MQFEMKMPDLATTDSAIRIGRWMVAPGETVKRGQPLLEVETDKAAMEVESVAAGVLVEIRAQVDDEVSVGDVIAVFDVADAKPSAATTGPSPAERSAPPKPPSASPTAAPPRPAAGAGGMFARNRAAAPSPPSSGGISLTLAQRTAAKRLAESKQTIPHFYVQSSVNAAAMAARRKTAEPAKIAWDAFFVRAVARAMKQFDRFTCRLEGDRLTPLAADAIGVAIDHEGELYVVPVDEPAAKTVEQISAEIRRNVERLKAGDPEVRKNRPARMTVTNLGVCNVETFIPIINPPEPAILGIGKVRPTAVPRDDGAIDVEPRCILTLCVDHRVASGRYAADFLDAIVRDLETLTE